MDDQTNQKLTEDADRVKGLILETAQEYKEDCLALLMLLRVLEQVHWQIRERLFHPALPDTRNELYQLLRDIEENGGWPYIERMKLRSLLIHLELSEEKSPPDPSSWQDESW
ncbi:hypothetical protein PCC7418_2710 [Halothece sp. PCC 7418]|uniref:hypothetical protein n=1 Tax=Halothece sp. (strain PCC 7418) TaxID=65093 RepID=UPI0002A07743|nr:hypothetical protein [Halothece sp. PCC 7418]AFZ44848.1 hypothetical protein PCC7418_2710 [Halothece sp. PCC 7418]